MKIDNLKKQFLLLIHAPNNNHKRVAICKELVAVNLKYCPYCGDFLALKKFHVFGKGYSPYCKLHHNMHNKKLLIANKIKKAVELNIVADTIQCGCLNKCGICNNSCTWLNENTILLNPEITEPIYNDHLIIPTFQHRRIVPSKLNFK